MRASLLCGGDGMVTGLGNAKIEPYVEMYRAYEAGDTETVKKCQAKINVMYKIVHGAGYGNGNGAIKMVTELNGRGSRWMREKALTLDGEKYAAIARSWRSTSRLNRRSYSC